MKKNISESGCGEIEFAIAVRERRSHWVFTHNGTRRYLLREKTLPSTAPVVRDGAAFSVRNFFFFWRWRSPAFCMALWRVPAKLSPAFSSALNRREPDYHIWLVSEHLLFRGRTPPSDAERPTLARVGVVPTHESRARDPTSAKRRVGSPSTAFEPNGEGLVHGWKRDRERSV